MVTNSAKAVKIKMSAGREKGSGQLVLQGNLTLDSVDEVLRAFREAVQKYEGVSIRVERVSGVDLGFLQLLYALETAVKNKGGELSVRMDLEKDLELLLRNTGFGRWLTVQPAKEKK